MKNIVSKLASISAILIIFFGFGMISGLALHDNNNPIDSLMMMSNSDITKQELFLHIEYLASEELGGRGSGSIGDSLAREYIASEFKRYGLSPKGSDGYFQFFEKGSVNNGWYYGSNSNKDVRRTANVIGFLEGSDPDLKNEIVVIGAHFDHEGIKSSKTYNGADDNASGTSGVLELAQKFAANPDVSKRSLMFICFDAEEDGLLGSYYFTGSNIFKENKIVAMINLDMIGRLRYNTLVINGAGTSGIWETLAKDVNKSYDFSLDIKKKGLDGSDHTPFISKNIPSVFLFTGLHNEYHTPADDYWKINFDGLEKIVSYAFDLISSLNNETTIEFTNPNKKKF